MSVSHPAVKAVPAALLSLSALLALSIFLLTGCGGGGGGGSTTPATPTITSVTVACSPASILTTQTSTCTATVQGTGSYSSAVTWAASNGTITSSGVFTPTVAGTVIVTATSTEDSTKSGTASIVVGNQTTNGEWTWMGGSDTASASGIYGSLGVAAASNVPGARFSAVSWKDSSGNLWLFGGIGVDSTGAQGPLNDLWKFNPTNNQWTWMSGSSIIGASESGQSGVYGTQGVAAASNVPGARFNAVGWTDSSGNLWLFGGCDDDSTGHGVPFNDLWEFNSTTKEWTWVGGSSTPSAVGVWVGTPSTSNIPSSRYSAVSWADDNGNFWLFGGVDNYSAPVNDLWEYTPTTKEWTRVSGSSAGNTPGSYGTLGVASTSNVPGSRWNAVSWIDTSGNLWLFGGWGVDSADNFGDLNDLWEFSPSATTWTWVKGSSTAGASGEFGTLGVAAAANVPCARNSSVSWTDTNGNLWLFGGQGNGAVGTTGDLSDLWEFSTTTKEWTWASGSDTIGASGVYGTLGVASASNIPGGRYGSVSWTVSVRPNAWMTSLRPRLQE